jgi:hypothetical protein
MEEPVRYIIRAKCLCTSRGSRNLESDFLEMSRVCLEEVAVVEFGLNAAMRLIAFRAATAAENKLYL